MQYREPLRKASNQKISEKPGLREIRFSEPDENRLKLREILSVNRKRQAGNRKITNFIVSFTHRFNKFAALAAPAGSKGLWLKVFI